MRRIAMLMLGGAGIALSVPAAAAESVLVQCGREYQAAKSAGTLNGMDWTAYRTACAERLKGGGTAAPVSETSAAAPAVPPPAPASTAVPSPATTPAGSARAASAGMTAMHARQKQCGAEWRADKVKLVAQTPGLTWPKYWSQCNTRLKAAGG